MKIDTTAKQLLFSTVRIINLKTAGTQEVGTGFIVECQLDPANGQTTPMVVTNRHVIADSQMLTLEFTKQDPASGEPMIGSTHCVNLQDPTSLAVFHPDPAVDVAVMPLWPVQALLQKSAVEIFYRSIPVSTMPTEAAAEEFDAIEEITFVGYPDGTLDPVHRTPIIRRAVTATPIALPFGGRPVFLIDGSVFWRQ